MIFIIEKGANPRDMGKCWIPATLIPEEVEPLIKMFDFKIGGIRYNEYNDGLKEAYKKDVMWESLRG